MSDVTIQCRRYRERLPEYAEGRLSGPAGAALEQHLASCPRCAQEVTDLRAVIAAARAIPPEAPPERLAANVLRAVRAAAQPRRVSRPFWPRVAIPATAAVGLLAAVLGYRLMEQGHTPKSMEAALRAQNQQADRAHRAPAAAPVSPSSLPKPRASQGASQVVTPPSSAAGRRQTAAPPALEPAPAPRLNEEAAATSDRVEREKVEADHSAAAESGPPGPPGPAAPAPAKAGGGPTRHRGESNLSGRDVGLRAQGERKGARLATPVGAAAQKQERQPPAARAVLTRQGDQLALAVQLAAGPSEKVELKADGKPLWSWSGAKASDELIVVSLEGKDSGPKAIPITLTSPEGTRNYTLFAPPFAQLGEQRGTRLQQYHGAPLSTVLTDMSAKGGLVLLVEGPLDREVNGELDFASPKKAVETLAKYGGYTVSSDDLLVFTLTPR